VKGISFRFSFVQELIFSSLIQSIGSRDSSNLQILHMLFHFDVTIWSSLLNSKICEQFLIMVGITKEEFCLKKGQRKFDWNRTTNLVKVNCEKTKTLRSFYYSECGESWEKKFACGHLFSLTDWFFFCEEFCK